jgi:hypothetical protein
MAFSSTNISLFVVIVILLGEIDIPLLGHREAPLQGLLVVLLVEKPIQLLVDTTQPPIDVLIYGPFIKLLECTPGYETSKGA